MSQKRWGWLIASGVTIACASATARVHGDDPWASLVAAERAFSDDSAARGVRASFLTYFEQGVLTFPAGKPMQVGTRHLQSEAPNKGVLTWRPVKAEVSTAGDFGYTTGPYEFRIKKDDALPASMGTFTSVWRRRTDGPWKVIADFGTTGPPSSDADSQPVQPRPRRPIKKPSPTTGEVLVAEDHKFSTACEHGARNGYDRFITDDVRFYRDGIAPAIGREATLRAVDQIKATISWFPERARISDGGDIGYTTGNMKQLRTTLSGTEYMKYLRIWRKEGGKWKVVLDVANSAPAPEE